MVGGSGSVGIPATTILQIASKPLSAEKRDSVRALPSTAMLSRFHCSHTDTKKLTPRLEPYRLENVNYIRALGSSSNGRAIGPQPHVQVKTSDPGR